jgi:dipeptidyl aminopeptidase/acylaminoacyl peptidase
VPLDGGPGREILRLRQPDVILLGDWTRDGRAVTFVKGRTLDGRNIEPRRELWIVSDDGSPPRSLNIVSEGLQDVRMHPDGERLAFRSGGRRRELWVLENVLAPLSQPANQRPAQ